MHTETKSHVAAPHWRARLAGESVIARGGSAVDAAIATASVLCVVYPHMVSLGGDAWALVSPHPTEVVGLNGSGRSAAADSIDRLRATHGAALPTYGIDTVTVPGGVAAWWSLHQRYGNLPWSELFLDATAAARNGAPVAAALARDINQHQDKLRKDPGMAGAFFHNGLPLAAGDTLLQPRLADTLASIAENGADDFYRGDLARLVIAGLRRLGSALSIDDLGAHRSEFVDPLLGHSGPFDVYTTPPNSQGFVLLQLLAALEQMGVSSRVGAERSADVARLFSLSNRERERYLADPMRLQTGVEELLSSTHISHLIAQAESNNNDPPLVSSPRPDGDTVAIVSMDDSGQSVTLIQSIYYSFGSMILEPQTGIVLQNRGTSFRLDGGHPASWNPATRPPHTLMPVMLARNGRVEYAVGTMGGQAQAQIQSQLIHNLAFGDTPLEAVSRARWAVGPYGEPGVDAVLVEQTLPKTVRSGLAGAGMPVLLGGERDDRAGHSQIAHRTESGIVTGTDPRADAMEPR